MLLQATESWGVPVWIFSSLSASPVKLRCKLWATISIPECFILYQNIQHQWSSRLDQFTHTYESCKALVKIKYSNLKLFTVWTCDAGLSVVLARSSRSVNSESVSSCYWTQNKHIYHCLEIYRDSLNFSFSAGVTTPIGEFTSRGNGI